MAIQSNRPGDLRLRDQIRFLLDTARALSREADLDMLFGRLHELIAEQFPAWTFFIVLHAGDEQQMRVPFYVEDGERFKEDRRLPIAGTITGEVFVSGRPRLIQTAEEFDRLRAITIGPGDTRRACSAIFAPLRAGDRTIGVISVQSEAPHSYDEEDLDLLVALGEQTAIAVLNAWRMTEIDQQRRELELLVEIGRGLASDEFSLEQMCRRIHAELSTIIDAHVFYVALLSEDGKSLHPEYCIDGTQEQPSNPIPLEHTFAETVLAGAQPVVVSDLHTDPRVRKYERFGDDATAVRSLIMLPLQIGQRRLGIVSVQSPRTGSYDGAALQLLRSITDQLALAVNNVQLYRRTAQRADRDALTNLYNRRYGMRRLAEELEQAGRRGKHICLLMIDLDNFKEINDTHGHPVGDVVLTHMADALRHSCRASDIVCRYGGDEFMVIFPNVLESETESIASRVREELKRRAVPVPNGSLAIEASIGVAVSQSGMDADALLLAADRALYRDKERARRH
ncbi:MAG TPA: sensor domain-containing diguanylate cyclase [Candidatus Baltobacteraceae bacterium]|nr:sensor domain-containing diguanylate cyclase [Candidatus Baltobacteraceae bacterium]